MSGTPIKTRKSARLRETSPKQYVYDSPKRKTKDTAETVSCGKRSGRRSTANKPSTSATLEDQLSELDLSDTDDKPVRRRSPRKSKETSKILKQTTQSKRKLFANDKSDSESNSDGFEDIIAPDVDVPVHYSHKYFVEQCILNGNKNKTVSLSQASSKGKATIQKLDNEEIQELLKNQDGDHVQEKKQLLDKHRSFFERWEDLMIDNFNILLYGVGSKMALLNEFSTEQLAQELRVVVHGFFPTLTMKEILNSITNEALDHTGTFTSVLDQITFIKEYLEEKELELYLIIHNLDGAALASDKSISTLSQLARSNHVHIIATVDHVNSGLLFDTNKSSLFKWLWFETHTYESYRIETSYENSMQMQQSENLAISSLRHVYLSLTPNAQGIFRLLAKSQMEKSDESSFSGLSFTELFRQCREAFLVNSDLTLRTQLIEFKDHNMLKIRKAADGLEYLYIPVNASTLSQFVDEINNS